MVVGVTLAIDGGKASRSHSGVIIRSIVLQRILFAVVHISSFEAYGVREDCSEIILLVVADNSSS